MKVAAQTVVLEMQGDPAMVNVSIEGPASPSTWLQLRALYSSDGHTDGKRISVGPEVFLSSAPTLKAVCKRHGLGVRLDPGVRSLLEGIRALRSRLEAAISEPSPLSETDVLGVLARSRFSRELTAFQLRDLCQLLALPHGANFSVPGAGKTTVAYATYEAERTKRRVDRLAVIGPLSAFDAWASEAEACFNDTPRVAVFDGAIDLRCEVLLTNYQRLASSYEAVATWIDAAPTHLILDEAHRVKRGWEGTWGRACLNLAFLAMRRDVLTGTPAPQSLEDLLALFDFLWPNVGRRELPSTAELRRASPDDVASVSRTIGPLYVRTRKAELALREPTFSAIRVPLDGLHFEIYEALRDRYAGELRLRRRDRVTMAKLGQVVMYLIEAATNPALLAAGSSPLDPVIFRHPPLGIESDAHLVDLLKSFGSYETPKKFEVLASLVKANVDSGRKTLIWTNFVRNITTLERMFRRYKPAIIHGGVPLEGRSPTDLSRARELRRFRHDDACRVLIANPAAAGEGVSLHHTCHDAIYVDRTFNAGQYLQSVDRIHRLGLSETQETRITFLISKGTIDETIDRRVREKAERLGNILDDPDISTMALPDEEEYGPPVESDEDVDALFEHLLGE